MQNIGIDFTSKKISPWGGIHLFHSVYDRYGIRRYLKQLDLPMPGSNRGIDPVEVVESFLVSVVLGSRRLAHSGMIRTDEVIRQIFGWIRPSPSQSTFSRFFQKFDKERNDRVFPSIQKMLYHQVKISKMTIDIDSTVITRYGSQECAIKGYNPEQKGKASHHPIIAFCDELKMVLNAWMRSGDSHTSTDIEEFLDELFQIIDSERIGLIRMDSGFYNSQIMNKLELRSTPIEYIIKAKMTARIRTHIANISHWYKSNENMGYVEYAECSYKGTNWEKSRRLVVCRVKKSSSHSRTHNQNELFPEILEQESYDYFAFVTNSNLACSLIHTIYNKRGDCENIIKELKYDYAIDGFALQGFYPMEAAFRLIMLAYNIMVIFKQSVMTSKHSHRLSTIKFQCIALGSFIVKNGRNKILKLSAEGKRRHFLEKIFEKVDLLPPNFIISNA